MAAFHLLRLPYVAMDHVLCIMNLDELISLSLVSSRAKRTVTNFSRTKPIICVHLGFADEPWMKISRKNEEWMISWTSNERSLGYEIKSGRDHFVHQVCNYSMNPIEDWMKAYDYIKGILGCEIEFLQFELSSSSTLNKSIVDFLHSQQNSIGQMNVFNVKKGSEDNLKYLLNNTIITEKMKLFIRAQKGDFQMDIPTITHSIYMSDCRFIDFEQLQRLKNRCIWLNQSVLTAHELNRFLKSWMAFESHLELETFRIEFSGSETMEVIMDLPHKETTDQNFIEAFTEEFSTRRGDKLFDIKRSDGKVATVGFEHDGHRFNMLIH
uniref:F-box domain-containing protein n=1 Tax=Caenorhabditis tropicalis TaxID=1561998 RepID=A0A1I7TH73_9PELO